MQGGDSAIGTAEAGARPGSHNPFRPRGPAQTAQDGLDCGRLRLTSHALQFLMMEPNGKVGVRELPWTNVRWIAAGIGREWGYTFVAAMISFIAVTAFFWYVVAGSDGRAEFLAALAAPNFWSAFNRHHAILIVYGFLAVVVPGSVVVRDMIRTDAGEGWMEIAAKGGVLIDGLLYDVPEKKVFRKAKGEPVRFVIDIQHVGRLLKVLGESGRARRPSFAERLFWRFIGYGGRAHRLT